MANSTGIVKRLISYRWSSYEEPDPAIPQQKPILKDMDPEQFLKKAAKVLKCDPEMFKKSRRIKESDKLNRDILLYLLWQKGNYSNSQIGDLFDLTYSAVSRRVVIMRKEMEQDKAFGKRVIKIKSLIKP